MRWYCLIWRSHLHHTNDSILVPWDFAVTRCFSSMCCVSLILLPFSSSSAFVPSVSATNAVELLYWMRYLARFKTRYEHARTDTLMMTKKLKTQYLLLTIQWGWSCEDYRRSIADPYSTNTIGGTNAIMACRSLIGHWGNPYNNSLQVGKPRSSYWPCFSWPCKVCLND